MDNQRGGQPGGLEDHSGEPNQESNLGSRSATPQRKSQEDEEGLSPGALQEGAAQVLRALGAGADQNISMCDLSDPIGSQEEGSSRGEREEEEKGPQTLITTHSSRSRVLPERAARPQANKLFADPFTQGLLWGKQKAPKRKRKQ